MAMWLKIPLSQLRCQSKDEVKTLWYGLQHRYDAHAAAYAGDFTPPLFAFLLARSVGRSQPSVVASWQWCGCVAFVVKRSKDCHMEHLRAEDLLLLKNTSKYIHKSHKSQLASYLHLDFSQSFLDDQGQISNKPHVLSGWPSWWSLN